MNSHGSGRPLHVGESRRGGAGVVLEMSIQEFEPSRAVEAAGDWWRQRRHGLLSQESRARAKARGEKEEEDGESQIGHPESRGAPPGGSLHDVFSIPGFRFALPDSRLPLHLAGRRDISTKARRSS